jgi:hypothetical protein
MKLLGTVSVVSLALLMTSGSFLAHHGTRISYDRQNPVTLQGKVSDLFWRNPHVGIFVDVTDDSGETVTWALEAGPLRSFARSGITRSMLEKGQEVTFVAFPSKAGAPVGQLDEIHLSDGTSTPVEFD